VSIIILLPVIVFLISICEKIRPSSSENESETSTAENEIERLQSRNQRLTYEFNASQNNSRKQEKIINQLEMKLKNEAEQLKNEKLKNEKLEQENIPAIKSEMRNMNCKFKFVTTIFITLIAIMVGIIIWQVHENHKYKNEKQNCDNDLKDIQTKLQSRDHENQKYRNDLQEKQKELQAREKQYYTFIDCE